MGEFKAFKENPASNGEFAMKAKDKASKRLEKEKQRQCAAGKGV